LGDKGGVIGLRIELRVELFSKNLKRYFVSLDEMPFNLLGTSGYQRSAPLRKKTSGKCPLNQRK
jgi:hypothetical protein